MAKMYFRYGVGKSSNLCQTAYNYNEMGMNVKVMDAANNDIASHDNISESPIFSRKIDYMINDSNIYEDILRLENKPKCILVDNAHLLSSEHAFELFLVANLLDITVITYGDRMIDGKRSDGSMRLMELANIIEPVEEEYINNGRFEFYYGAMNASKTAKLLYKYHLMKEQGYKVMLVKPATDRNVYLVKSRVGLEAKADIILDRGNDIFIPKDTDYVLVDEAQFLESKQIDEMKNICRNSKTNIRCYGLKNDFRTYHFEGSGRLLETATNIVKMKTICRCGDGAEFNARMDLEGNYLSDGESVCVDDGKSVKYTSLCPKCYIEKVLKLKK